MARHYRELLNASRLLLTRAAGQRGRLPGARIRRSISTTYYALFHFLTEESTARLAGRGARHLRRRRLLARSFTHTGMKATMARLTARTLSDELRDFIEPGLAGQPIPDFVLRMATAFMDAQVQRHRADYNLNTVLSEADAQYFVGELETVIERWLAARTPADEDLKGALALLLLVGGKLRGDDL